MLSDFRIPTHEVQRRLSTDNPWWKAGNDIDDQQAGWPRRAFFDEFANLATNLEPMSGLVLIGPSQVGKTAWFKPG